MIPVLDPMLCDRGLPAGDLSSWAAEPKLDGELVAGAGRASDFYAVLPRVAGQRPNAALSIWFFDVLWMEGDLTGRAYRDRRAVLEGLAMPAPCGVLPRWPGPDVADLLAACVELDVEGVVLKRLRSAYRCGERSRWWRKVKAPGWVAEHAQRRGPQPPAV